jgi:hypothetical protein
VRASIVLVASAALMACGAGGDADRPEAPDGVGDIRVYDAGPQRAPGSYDFVAQRPYAIVGLAEARGLSKDVANATVDTIADTLDGCAKRLDAAGKLTSGAARVVAIIDKGGAVAGLKPTFSAGGGVEANAILCLVAPIKQLTFAPTSDDAQRGIAIEATWGVDATKPKPANPQ